MLDPMLKVNNLCLAKQKLFFPCHMNLFTFERFFSPTVHIFLRYKICGNCVKIMIFSKLVDCASTWSISPSE